MKDITETLTYVHIIYKIYLTGHHDLLMALLIDEEILHTSDTRLLVFAQHTRQK